MEYNLVQEAMFEYFCAKIDQKMHELPSPIVCFDNLQDIFDKLLWLIPEIKNNQIIFDIGQISNRPPPPHLQVEKVIFD